MDVFCEKLADAHEHYSFTMGVEPRNGQAWFTVTATPKPLKGANAAKPISCSSFILETACLGVEAAIHEAGIDRRSQSTVIDIASRRPLRHR